MIAYGTNRIRFRIHFRCDYRLWYALWFHNNFWLDCCYWSCCRWSGNWRRRYLLFNCFFCFRYLGRRCLLIFELRMTVKVFRSKFDLNTINKLSFFLSFFFLFFLYRWLCHVTNTTEVRVVI